MIRLEKVDKYFFRRKKNEIHAINQTSLEFSDTGLVALLGPSGCGKTTLLNAIGGLDKVDKGNIYVDGERITRRLSGKTDQIRTLKIGYIFQNYNLIDQKTVSENVALALNMLGIKNKHEVDTRVDYVLDKVGMYRYRNRYADMLSGGERQRVGIARAIVKNPQVIIADEPTGNLDSRNTLEVMNIIKSISRERLVILVTHEEELANFYADRIIRIQDGKVISDEWNAQARALDYRIDNRHYLKDIPDHKQLNTDQYNIHFYNKGGVASLNILIEGGNIYIQPIGENQNIEIVDDSSAVEMIDDHDMGMSEEEIQRQAVDLHRLDTFAKKKYTSIFNPITLFRQGFKTISSYPIAKKLLLVGFFFSAAVITIATTLFFGVFNIPDSKFTTAEKDYLIIGGKDLTTEVYEQYENDDLVKYILPGDSQIHMKIDTDDLVQTSNRSMYLSGSVSDIENVSSLVSGEMPKNPHEIVVDKMVVKHLLNSGGNDEGISSKNVGLSSYKDFIGRKLTVPNVDAYTIVGITNRQVPCIYVEPEQFITIISNAKEPDEFGSFDDFEFNDGMEEEVDEPQAEMNVVDVKTIKDVGLFEGGKWPEKPYEVLINYWPYKDSKTMKVGKELNKKVNGHKLKIVGFYSDKHPESNYALATEETVKLATIEKKKKATIYPAGKKSELKAMLEENGFKVTDVYAKDRERYLKEQRSLMISVLVFSGIMILISFIEIFLMIRASFLSRIKEVGTYRAIGVKKRDIYKMFSGEIVAITAIASLPGFCLATLIVSELAKDPNYADHFMVNSGTLLVSLIAIVVLNMFFGLIPVGRTIRKPPAAILARTDIN